MSRFEHYGKLSPEEAAAVIIQSRKFLNKKNLSVGLRRFLTVFCLTVSNTYFISDYRGYSVRRKYGPELAARVQHVLATHRDPRSAQFALEVIFNFLLKLLISS